MPALEDIVMAYPGALTDDELGFLLSLAEHQFTVRAPRFAAWLAQVARGEINRREVNTIAGPSEPDLPRLKCSTWPTHELAKGVSASYLGYAICRDLPDKLQAKKLLDRVHYALCVWLESRITV